MSCIYLYLLQEKNKLFLQQIFDVHSGTHTVLGTANEQGCSNLVPVSIALTYQWERQTTYMENLFGKKKKKLLDKSVMREK